MSRGMRSLAGQIVLILLLCSLMSTVSALAELEIHFLDVGQGDAAIVLCDGYVMMIDGGKPENSQFIYSYLTGTLGLSQIDVMVLSHPHNDHVGGLSAALSACQTERILTPLFYYDDPVFLRFREMAAERNLLFEMPLPGTEMSLGGAGIVFLGPYRLFGDTNDNSIMMRLDYGQTSFLFTGDAEIPEEVEVLERVPELLHVDVLKVGHHGSSSSSGVSFLTEVRPEMALIGVGAGNTYGHPAHEVLDRFREMNTQVYRTDLHGTIVLTSDGNTVSVRTERVPESPESVYTLSWADYLTETPQTHPEAEYYVGNVKSQRFHLPECEGAVKMSEKNKIRFDTRQEAIQAGYQPCGTCKP
ncbi:MAG: MBL fold metallo-hydrolase [Clostridia bacterium]|nr:MBL fold metallo-hydrolase [Clostridia bacterium]